MSTYGPMATHKRSLEIAKKELAKIISMIEDVVNTKIPALEKKLIDGWARPPFYIKIRLYPLKGS